MNTLSLTLPMERKALMRAAEMLHKLSSDLNPVISEEEMNSAVMTAMNLQEGETPFDPIHKEETASEYGSEPDPQVIFAAPKSEVYQIAPSVSTPDTPTETPSSDTVVATPSPSTLPAGVEVDSEGLPWDERIHSSSKGKIKGDKTWKKKRKVDPALVTQVEAELRQLMQAQPGQAYEPPKPQSVQSAAALDTSTQAVSHTHAPLANESPKPSVAETVVAPTPPTSGPVAPTTGAADVVPPVNPGTFVEQQFTVGTLPTTFPGLMTEITSKAVPPEVTNAAVRKHGVQSLVMLAARPDLIPHVAAELFKVV